VPAQHRVVVAQLLALGDPKLLADEVDTGDLLGDGVLDLQSGVDLQERDQPVLPDEELARASADVAGLLHDLLRSVVQLRQLRVGEERGGRLLDDLLIAALQRAVACGDHHHVAVTVGQDLRLDVPRLVEVALDEALPAAERGDGLTHGRVIQLGDLLPRPGDLQPAATATERGLDGNRQAVLVGEGENLIEARDRVGGAGREGRTDLQRDMSGGGLVAERGDRRRGRTDPGQAGVEDGLRELRVLGQEPVAGVHRVGPGLRARREDLRDGQV
jgi:hypothetical protein